MLNSFKMELVVTRQGVPDDDANGVMDKFREIRDFANARGLVGHFFISMMEAGLERTEKQ